MIISCKVTFIECYNSRFLSDVFLPFLYPDRVVVVIMHSDIIAKTLPLSQSEEVQVTGVAAWRERHCPLVERTPSQV